MTQDHDELRRVAEVYDKAHPIHWAVAEIERLRRVEDAAERFWRRYAVGGVGDMAILADALAAALGGD